MPDTPGDRKSRYAVSGGRRFDDFLAAQRAAPGEQPQLSWPTNGYPDFTQHASTRTGGRPLNGLAVEADGIDQFDPSGHATSFSPPSAP